MADPVLVMAWNGALAAPRTIGNWKLAMGNSTRTLDALFRESSELEGGQPQEDLYQAGVPPSLRRLVPEDLRGLL